jgi:hypothetical protein
MDGKFYNTDPLASSEYTDKLGNTWMVAKDDALGSWWAEPAQASSAKYGIPISTDRHRITGSDKEMVADGIDEAVYRWRITKGDLVSLVKPASMWPLVLFALGLYYADKSRRR